MPTSEEDFYETMAEIPAEIIKKNYKLFDELSQRPPEKIEKIRKEAAEALKTKDLGALKFMNDFLDACIAAHARKEKTS